MLTNFRLVGLSGEGVLRWAPAEALLAAQLKNPEGVFDCTPSVLGACIRKALQEGAYKPLQHVFGTVRRG